MQYKKYIQCMKLPLILHLTFIIPLSRQHELRNKIFLNLYFILINNLNFQLKYF